MNMTILRDRGNTTAMERDLLQKLIDMGITTVDMVVNLTRDEVERLPDMNDARVARLEEILLREGLYLGMSPDELRFSKLEVLSHERKVRVLVRFIVSLN